MKISYSWLKKYIDFNLSPKELSNKLTLAGLEVESLEGDNESDALLEVNITPNRPDCLSIIGIAREVMALTGNSVKYPENIIIEEGDDIKELTSVAIQDEHLCPRYSARVIKGVKVAPSPKWLVDKLHTVGIRSINNIVDITNFVLSELGHPLHAFDYDLLEENRIIVRRGISGERFVSLDNASYDINDTMLVIADGEKPVALAGVVGGKNTEVSEKTTNILLESAYFEPTQVRRTARKLGIQTESSYRFERGADPDGILKASNRAVGLILKLAGGKASKGVIDIYPSLISPREITLRLNRINMILGTKLTENQIINYLEKLGFSVFQEENEGCYKVTVPSYRRDISREIDLIEEIARLHGYDNIEVKTPQYRIGKIHLNKFYSFMNEAKTYFQGKGFCETINYSFINHEMQNMFTQNGKDLEKKSLFIQNPLSNEWGVMRKSLIPGLLNSLQASLNKGIEGIQLFEAGRQYNALENSEWPGAQPNGLPPVANQKLCPKNEMLPVSNTEVTSNTEDIKQNKNITSKEANFIAGIATSKVERRMWKKGGSERDIYYLKGIIETFMESAHLNGYEFKKAFLPSFNNLIEIYSGKNKIGIIGELGQSVSRKLNIKDTPLVFEINLDVLYKLRGKSTLFKPISKYPGVLRDLAVLMDREIQYNKIEDLIKERGTSLLKEMVLFDCYEGKSIPQGKKSLAYSLVFRDDKRTLKDDEVNSIFDKIVEGLAEKFDAHLRP